MSVLIRGFWIFRHIVSDDLEIGYRGSTAGAPIISQTFTATATEYIAEVATTANAGFVLKDVNQPNQAAGLFPTWVNGAIELETLVTPQDGRAGDLFALHALTPLRLAQAGSWPPRAPSSTGSLDSVSRSEVLQGMRLQSRTVLTRGLARSTLTSAGP
ncbi:hypothetical protein B0H14DRAFT_2795706, partial [Mycena olivaceomarginata]